MLILIQLGWVGPRVLHFYGAPRDVQVMVVILILQLHFEQ